MDPEKIGFPPGPPGHKLRYRNADYGDYHSFECECGHVIPTTRIKADGKIGAHGLRQWRWHMDQVDTPHPDEYIPMGVIEQARTLIEVFVIGREHPDLWSWQDNPAYNGFVHRTVQWHDQYGYAIAIKKAPTSKRSRRPERKEIVGIARTKVDAVAQADNYLTRHQDRGYLVKRGDDVDLTPPPMHPESSFVDLLNRVDKIIAEGNLLEIQQITEEVNQVLGMVPVLRDKKQKLEEARSAEVQRMLR